MILFDDGGRGGYFFWDLLSLLELSSCLEFYLFCSAKYIALGKTVNKQNGTPIAMIK